MILIKTRKRYYRISAQNSIKSERTSKKMLGKKYRGKYILSATFDFCDADAKCRLVEWM